jgi:hypothetical protein
MKEKLLTTSKDMFDRNIDMYGGARLIDIGTCSDQLTDIIGLNEDPLNLYSSDTSTSIYAAKFGVGEYLWGIQEYPMEVTDKGLLEGKPVYRTEVDHPIGLAMIDPRSIGRLCNIFPDNVAASS